MAISRGEESAVELRSAAKRARIELESLLKQAQLIS
jgi:hypothetical protein